MRPSTPSLSCCLPICAPALSTSPGTSRDLDWTGSVGRPSALGTADEGQRRHLAGDLHHGHRPARRGGARVREEDPEDAEQRNRLGPATSKRGTPMTKVRDLHTKWMKDSEYRKAHEALAPEFELARTLIQARAEAGLTQEQLAKRIATN